MKRRAFLSAAGALGAAACGALPCNPALAAALRSGLVAHSGVDQNVVVQIESDRGGGADLHPGSGVRTRPRTLILVELKGGNDGLNTVVPYAQPAYRQARPTLAVPPRQVLPLDAGIGLHPALAALWPLWQRGELAVVQGLGYAQPTASHFRAAQIWETASGAQHYETEGWVARAWRAAARRDPGLAALAAGATVLHDGHDAGPLAGVACAVPAGSMAHTDYPCPIFSVSAQALMHRLAAAPPSPWAALKLTLHGFDTHFAQAGRHANLLAQLADGLIVLRSALVDMGRWENSVVMTYGEFGRAVHENAEQGTDHGSAAPHFVMGGAVRGGILGPYPRLDRLEASGGVRPGIDFRQLLATVLSPWWGLDAAHVFDAQFATLPLFRV